jgi:hypothetical protein
MLKYIYGAVMSLALGYVHGQNNLVPNPSFEVFDSCPTAGGEIRYANNWRGGSTYSSPDYFNVCAPSLGYGVPASLHGSQNARTGNGYAGIVTSTNNPLWPFQNECREYIQAELIQPLIAGLTYEVSFYVSRSDSSEYISNNIGAYFSVNPDTINTPSGYNVFPYTPQVDNPLTNPLDNDSGWTKVSGTFVANGGEKYLMIGNFHDSQNTSVVFVGGCTACSYGYFGFYFIDDVSVVLMAEPTGGLNSDLHTRNLVYPQPTEGIFYLRKAPQSEDSWFEVLNGQGSVVKAGPVESQVQMIDLNGLPNGIYYLKTDSGLNEIMRVLKR